METPETMVIFRKWSNGDVIALFPQIDGLYPGECLSYEHVGQHGIADYNHVVRKTKPANPKEYTELKKELTRIGYSLTVRQRWGRGAA